MAARRVRKHRLVLTITFDKPCTITAATKAVTSITRGKR